MSRYIIDFQGFNCEYNSYIIKELTITDLYGDLVLHYLFLPPFDISLLGEKELKRVHWLQQNHHKIDWNDGLFEYSSAFSVLREAIKDAHYLYIKGSERASFLRKITSKLVIDLDYYNCPRASCLPLPPTVNINPCYCKTHVLGDSESGVCSLVQALKFKLWLRDLFDNSVDEVDL